MSSPQLNTIDTSTPMPTPAAELVAEPDPAEVWAFVDAWYQAEQWQAAADYAAVLVAYVHALQAATPRQAQAPAPWPAGPPRPTQPASGGAPGGFLACVRQRESGGSYTVVNRSSGAGGAYQFLPSTWVGSGAAARTGVPRAELATPAQQDAEAARLYASSGRSPWAGPGC